MIAAMNVPYVKQFDKNGVVTNPISKGYFNEFQNRKERRAGMQKKRFHGESNNLHLTVIGSARYLRFKQTIRYRDMSTKTIEHYILCN